MGEGTIVRVLEGIGWLVGWALFGIFRLMWRGGRALFDRGQRPKSFTPPLDVRFEHTLIVGGSGHGKTQLLQNIFLHEDLYAVIQGYRSAIFIDSQGDMLQKILHLAELAPPRTAVPISQSTNSPSTIAETPPAKNSVSRSICHVVLVLIALIVLWIFAEAGFQYARQNFAFELQTRIVVVVGILLVGACIGAWLRGKKKPVTVIEGLIAFCACAGIFLPFNREIASVVYTFALSSGALALGFILVQPMRLFGKWANASQTPLVLQAGVKPLSDRLVLIDPNDIENPPCLNLFDFGIERIKNYPPVEQERLVNGAISLYEYMFGALLGAEMTNRQGTIFRYLARLLMVVPNPTIYTLMDFMEEPEKVRPYLPKLDIMTQRFFNTQFFTRGFDMTREQILNRLWGVLSNNVLARMFSHTENKLNLFDAMNNGSLILINTAKDLLKQEGCEIFGRFMIALISQATQERAILAENQRKPTFFYIDEAKDYFDDSLEDLLNTARKYKVGLILATQNLGQFSTRLLATTLASTSIKFAGGVSNQDARVLAGEMNLEHEAIMAVEKNATQTHFVVHYRNITKEPTAYVVPLGELERMPKMGKEAYQELLQLNRKRFTAPYDPSLLVGSSAVAQSGAVFPLEEARAL